MVKLKISLVNLVNSIRFNLLNLSYDVKHGEVHGY